MPAAPMSYAGELGWELHGPREAVKPAYDAIWQAGEPLGLVDYGSFAMNSMRLEKAFKGAGELTNEVTLPEADVMRFVRLDKQYLGVEATRKSAKSNRLPWVSAYLEISEDRAFDGHGGEAVLHNETVVGTTASMAYGHAVGKILTFAYVKPEAAAAGTMLKVVIAGNPRAATVLGAPTYDPENSLPRMEC